MRTLTSFSLLLSIICVTSSTKIDVDLINETIRNLLHFKSANANDTSPLRRPTHNLMTHMRELYQIFTDEDGNDDGNLVRAIDPAVGKLDGEEVIVFDIGDFDANEAIMRAELYFFLRRRDTSAKRRARQIRAKSMCVNEYCREQVLRRIKDTDNDDEEWKVVWDATKPVFDSYHLDAKQIVFRITRDRTKMRPYSEMVRRSTPFLVIYSQVNHTLDTSTVIRQAEQVKRKRREIGNADSRQYYSYNSIPLDEDKSLPKKKSPRKMTMSEELTSDDVWQGFGEATSKEEKEEAQDESNDVRVVLLQNKNKCRKEGTMFNLKQFGWDEWVMEPKTIETSFCKGKCAKPLSKASNHAMLQSLFASEPICCAPNNLKSLNLFYRDEKGRTVIRNYSKMLIGSCSCL